jgi:hypothetical protein
MMRMMAFTHVARTERRFAPNSSVILSVLACALGAGCAATVSGVTQPSTEADGAGTKNADRGDIKLQYLKTRKYRDLAEAIQGAKVLDEVILDLNKLLLLPHDVPVVFKECDGQINAFFRPNEKTITICYELIDFFADKMGQDDDANDVDTREDYVKDVIKFVFLHELGHALINIFHIAAPAGQESIVDQLAVYLLVEGGNEQAAVDGAEGMNEIDTPDEIAQVSNTPFWDAHPMGVQRFFNIVCWVYGSDPKGQHELLDKDDDSPLKGAEYRAAGCPAEYESLGRFWETALAPFIKG